VIDREWCEANASRILERDSRCLRCGHVTTAYGRQPWASVCEICGSDQVVPFGGLIREQGRAEPFMIGEE
jgi:ribosomal protein S27E